MYTIIYVFYFFLSFFPAEGCMSLQYFIDSMGVQQWDRQINKIITHTKTV